MPAPPLLRIYLNDHLAGATAGTALARRCLSRNRSGPLGDFLTRLVREIEEDRASLRDVMRRVGARQNPAKRAAARVLERAGLAKLNGSLTSYTPLSRLVELEGLSAGVEAKRLLWLSLRSALGSDPRLADIDFERLAERARSQREGLEEHRIAAAEQALAAGSVSRAGKA